MMDPCRIIPSSSFGWTISSSSSSSSSSLSIPLQLKVLSSSSMSPSSSVPFLSSLVVLQSSVNDNKNDDDDDPWAGHRLRTDESLDSDDEDSDNDEEDEYIYPSSPGTTSSSTSTSTTDYNLSPSEQKFKTIYSNEIDEYKRRATFDKRGGVGNDDGSGTTMTPVDDENEYSTTKRTYRAKGMNMSPDKYDEWIRLQDKNSEEDIERIMSMTQIGTGISNGDDSNSDNNDDTLMNKIPKKSEWIKDARTHIENQRTSLLKNYDSGIDDNHNDEEDDDDDVTMGSKQIHLASRFIGQMVQCRKNKERRESKLNEAKDTNTENDTTTPTITKQMDINNNIYKIFDVGSTPYKYLLRAANNANIILNVTVCNNNIFSNNKRLRIMIEETLDEYGGEHEFHFCNDDDSDWKEGADFVELVMGKGYQDNNDDKDRTDTDRKSNEAEITTTVPPPLTSSATSTNLHNSFDAVRIDTTLPTFFSIRDVYIAASTILKVDGLFAIIHSKGSNFVNALNDNNPDIVPNLLPSGQAFRKELCRSTLPFVPLDFVDDYDNDNADDTINDNGGGGNGIEILNSNNQNMIVRNLYYASAKRIRYVLVDKVVRLRGPVAKGYGRGSRKLGFPTANLPGSSFANVLNDVPKGVYLGWAVIETSNTATTSRGAFERDKGKGRNVVHMAVVNIGYSPTFKDSPNPERIVEAHLVPTKGENNKIEGDFYGETMRLSLLGYLRPEIKFDNFGALVAQIGKDRDDSVDALSNERVLRALGTDSFLTNACQWGNGKTGSWIGGNGGDDVASWEFEVLDDAIRDTPMGDWVI